MPLTEGTATSSPSYKPAAPSAPNAPQATPALAVATSPVAATRRPWSKRTKIIVAAVAAVALVAGVATVTVNALMPKNPLALTARSLMTLSKLKQGSFEVSGLDDGGVMSGSFEVGRDVKSSVADVTLSASGTSSRMAWMRGRGAIFSSNQYQYYEGASVDRGFTADLNDSMLAVRDSLVREGNLDVTEVLAALLSGSTNFIDVNDIDSSTAKRQLSDAFTKFIDSGLESKNAQSHAFRSVQNSIIPASSGSGRVHMLYYEISAPGIVGAFADWFSKNKSSYPDLDSVFSQLWGKDYLVNWHSQMTDTNDQREWKITLTYGNNLQFASLSIVPPDNLNWSQLGVKITSWNKNGPDEQQVKAFIDTAQRES